jgi:hypothetical protein
MDGLFIGLEVAQARLFGQILVYEADYGVNLLTGQSVAAAGQSAPHVEVPSVKVGGVAADYTVGALSGLQACLEAVRRGKVRSSEGRKPFPWRQACAVMWSS